METRTRSMAKAISYRVFSSLIVTTGIVFLFTHESRLAFGVGLTELLVKIVTYFIHERTWEMISFGRGVPLVAEFPIRRPLAPEDRQAIEKQLASMGYLQECA